MTDEEIEAEIDAEVDELLQESQDLLDAPLFAAKWAAIGITISAVLLAVYKASL